jgi:hypothetical protein
LHDGFYFHFANGPSALWLSGEGPNGSAGFSGSLGTNVSLAFGGTIVRGLVLAGALSGVYGNGTFRGGPPGSGGDISASAGGIAFLAEWFPDPTSGWHFGASVGVMALSARVPLATFQFVDASSSTVGLSAFGGYDFWIGPEWSIEVAALATTTTRASMQDNNGVDTGYALDLSSFGAQLALVYH